MKPALIFIVTTISQLYLFVMLLRFWLPWLKADFRNPISQGFARARSRDPGLTWRRFEIDSRNITRRLAAAGVNVRPAGNHHSADQELESEVFEDLMSQVEERKLRRTVTSAQADAATCAMVARWRRSDHADPARAWFIAHDTGTGKAYRRLRPEDPYKLSISPETWLLFLANIRSDEPGALADDVASLARVVTHQSVFAIASAYSVEETIQLAILLGPDSDPLSPEELREAVQLDFRRLLAEGEAPIDDDPERMLRVGAKLLARRTRQRELRASHAEELAKDREKDAQAREESAQEREQQAARRLDDAVAREAELIRQRDEASSRAVDADERAGKLAILMKRQPVYQSVILGLCLALGGLVLLGLRQPGFIVNR